MISRLIVVGLVCSDVLLELIVEPISKVAADTSSAMPVEYGSEPSLIGKEVFVLHADTATLECSNRNLCIFLMGNGHKTLVSEREEY